VTVTVDDGTGVTLTATPTGIRMQQTIDLNSP